LKVPAFILLDNFDDSLLGKKGEMGIAKPEKGGIRKQGQIQEFSIEGAPRPLKSVLIETSIDRHPHMAKQCYCVKLGNPGLWTLYIVLFFSIFSFLTHFIMLTR